MKPNEYFIEVGSHQHSKFGQPVAGDVFVSERSGDEGRTITILADGLGSGVKACVLATLTATMARRFVAADIDVRRAAEIIMATLPVCRQRKIAYSTFTIIDTRADGSVQVIEHDNPPFMLLAKNPKTAVQKEQFAIQSQSTGQRNLYYSRFQLEPEDRIVVCSDGVTQSGMGRKEMPLGWTDSAAGQFVSDLVSRDPGISARDLSRAVVLRANLNDHRKPSDDTSCAVVYLRRPRAALIATGPPINPAKDVALANTVRKFDGKTVICGGTTANIISRELKREITIDLSTRDMNVPPPSSMKGVDLVTEGTLTLSAGAELLEKNVDPEAAEPNAATMLLKHWLDSDIIRFLVGTKINDAHQDPNLPVELDIRRNLIKRIVRLLEQKHLKKASIEYI
ncbi:MAG: SpoIIE family protein phosphatase [Phycisphaerales bacterium]|jgi:hypothetical protein|nr:SpoIIE family protein phosphatase [Phycisphaerales bacterium]